MGEQAWDRAGTDHEWLSKQVWTLFQNPWRSNWNTLTRGEQSIFKGLWSSVIILYFSECGWGEKSGPRGKEGVGRDNEFWHGLYFEVSIDSLVNSHNTWKLGTEVPTTEMWLTAKQDSNKVENKTAKYLGCSKFKSVYLHTLLIKQLMDVFSKRHIFRKMLFLHE